MEVGAVEGGAFSVFGDFLLRRACVDVFMCCLGGLRCPPPAAAVSFFLCLSAKKKQKRQKREGSTPKKYVQD